jgi:hypothetical protein
MKNFLGRNTNLQRESVFHSVFYHSQLFWRHCALGANRHVADGKVPANLLGSPVAEDVGLIRCQRLGAKGLALRLWLVRLATLWQACPTR